MRLAFKSFGAAAFGTVLIGTSSLATSASAQSWTQVYGGVALGADALLGVARLTNPRNTDHLTVKGPAGGDLGLSLTLGADYQFGQRAVIGVFGTYDWSSIQTEGSFQARGASGSGEAMDIGQQWTLGARAGWLLTSNTLFYGLAGYSQIRLSDLKGTATDGVRTETASLSLPKAHGLALGAGLEHRLTSNLSLKAEYRVTSYAKTTILDTPDVRVDGQLTSHTARLGLNYRLGGDQAGDAQSSTPAQAPTWSGAYVAAGFGLNALVRDLTVRDTGSTDHGTLQGLGGGNFSGTVVGGYDTRLGDKWVVGAFGGFDAALASHKIKLSSNGASASLDLLNLSRSWTLGGRLGYLPAPDVLTYGFVGWSRVSFKDVQFAIDDESARVALPSVNGIVAGLGIEKALTPNWTLRAEYHYTALQSATIALDEARVELNPSSHAVKATASYRFGN